MAGLFCHVQSGEITVSSTAAKCALQIRAPANQRLKVGYFGVFCKGVLSTDPPVVVQVHRQTTNGTGSAVSITKDENSAPETVQSTAYANFTSLPASSATGQNIRFAVHPQSGYAEHRPYSREWTVHGGNRIGITVTKGATPSSLTLEAAMDFEE